MIVEVVVRFPYEEETMKVLTNHPDNMLFFIQSVYFNVDIGSTYAIFDFFAKKKRKTGRNERVINNTACDIFILSLVWGYAHFDSD